MKETQRRINENVRCNIYSSCTQVYKADMNTNNGLKKSLKYKECDRLPLYIIF